MSGRIKLLKDGAPVNDADDPPLPEDYYDVPGPFDETCGSYDLDDYQLPNSQCPVAFVCGAEDASSLLASQAECTDAMDCNMLIEMTTGFTSGDDTALFNQQYVNPKLQHQVYLLSF